MCVRKIICGGYVRARFGVAEFSGLGTPTPRMAATQTRRRAMVEAHFTTRGSKMKTLTPDPPYEKIIPHPDNRFMALTGNCSDMPTLFIDTHVPLDILMDAANHRLRAVIQVLENMCMRGSVECDSVILSDFAQLCVIPLRDGCDVLDVIGRRLRSMPA
jgi:hypothetical protein